MKREEELSLRAHTFGLTPHLPLLSLSKTTKAPQMAFRPGLWGLQIWISGEELFLLDEKGFLCSTPSASLALSLITFESLEGPGSLRVVLNRETLNPLSAVKVITPKYNPKAPVPSAPPEASPRPLRRRKLSEADFSALLKDL